MNKKSKLLLFLLVLSLLISCFSACNQGNKNAKVVKMQIAQQPTKTEYLTGELFDPTGLILLVQYEDGTTAEIKEGYKWDITTPLEEDDDEITITYQRKSILIEIDIEVKVPTSLEIDSEEGTVKTIYQVGEKFDKTGLKLLAKYEDGSESIITNGFRVSPSGILDASITQVKITYNKAFVYMPISVQAAVVTSISVETIPTKTEYKEGESFDSTGMVVKADYSDGSEVTILDYNYSPKTPLTTDIDKITISYGTFTTEVPISVMAVSKLLSISTAPTKTSYKEGENFDATGMVVSLRENGQTRVLSSSEYMITGGQNLAVGSQVKVVLTSDESIKTKVGITVSSEINVVESMITQAKYTASHPTLGKYAVNGDYVGNFEDQSTLITTVTSASAGKLGLTIKASSSWVSEYSTKNIYWPIKVSDVQANLVFEVYVNGIKVPIADNVKITGGETTDEGGDVSLLAKWTYVTLGNVDFKQGENEVKLVFLPQIYKNADVTSADGYIKEGVYSSPMIDTIKVECFETFGDAVTQPSKPIESEIDLNENHIKGNNTEEWAIAQNRTTAELRNSGSAVVQEALKISKNNNYITNLYGGSRIEVDLGATKSTTGKVVLKASSGYLTAVSWGDSKSKTGDMQFNKIFKVYIRHSDNSTTEINVEDSVVLTGKTGNYSIMANWQEVTFDNLNVNIGDVIVFESLAPKDGGGNYLYKDCGEWGTQSTPNVDTISIYLD